MKLLSVMLVLFAGLSASAKEIQCGIDEQVQGGSEADVEALVLQGNFGIPKVTEFKGNKVSAKYQMGDEFDGQSYLQLRFNDIISTTYNVNERSLYVLEQGDIRLQCWFE